MGRFAGRPERVIVTEDGIGAKRDISDQISEIRRLVR